MTSTRTTPPRTPTRTTSAAGALPVAAVVAVVAGVLGAVVTGAAAASAFGDPGIVVRWGYPVARVAHDAAAALAIGGLLAAAALLAPDHPAWARARALGNGAAVAWALAAVAVLVLGAADVVMLPLDDPRFGPALWQYVSSVDVGRQVAIEVALVAVVALLASAVRGPVGAGVAAVLALVALVPLALTSHSAGSASHELVVSSWWMHLAGVCAWSGGLATLAWLGRRDGLGSAVRAVAGRYSVVAGWSFALVAASGAANGWARVGGLEGMATPYGAVLLVKVIALVLLGFAGWWHRERLLRGLADGGAGRFWRLVAAEVVVMAVALGLGVALSRSASPVPDEPFTDPTPAELVTGEPLPPPLEPARLLTEVSQDVLWLGVVVAMVVVYLTWVRRLRARGDRWPLHRTVLWLLGSLLLLYVTCGGVSVYGRVLFSVHMVQHMTLSMVVPALLVFGAPVTLALRALPRRRDGSRGPREWLVGLVESPFARFVSHPVVAATVFVGSMIAFYFSPLFGQALQTHVGHELMMVHFLLAGYLFANGLVGVDPGPARVAYPMRLLLLFATMAFHAFFGVAITSTDTLLEATYFSSLGLGIDALADQADGGAIAWGIGEAPTVGLALLVTYQWFRSDQREAKRRDRKVDRDGDAELDEYNAMLERMQRR
jgi:cytochrome c oxidase assembly factor CtaG/putative copper export protein